MVRRSTSAAPRSVATVVGRVVGGVALLATAGSTALIGLSFLCGRPGRASSPVALCPYDPGTAALFLAVAGLSLGFGTWSLSMTRRPGHLRWFVAGGWLVVGVVAVLS